MADPVIGATVQVVLEKLLSLTIEEARSLRNCKKNLGMLKKNVSMIQAFIHDAERRQVEDQAVEKWLKMLERVAEDAENVFDEFRYETLKAEVMKIRTKLMEKVLNFFSQTAFKCKMSRKINNITEELRAINQLAKDLGLQSLMVPSRQILPIRETDSVVVASDVVGRDMDVAEIKEKIFNMREDAVLCSIPIVGMGGLGKTTVAKRIFNDEQIEKHFGKRVWLCLPEMSETKSFLEQILESLTKRKVEVQSRDIIVQTLRDELGEKKYLFVLDDLWHVNSTLWHEFTGTLRGINTCSGNCILVTTRMKQVASTVAVDVHVLGKLSEDHCWSIFKQRAFADGEAPEEMVSMKYRIVEICRGLPLAASVLGGLLRNKEKQECQAILDGTPLVAGEDDNGENSLKKILKLSYDYLPSPHLKKCFAYFAVFPKDFKFEKDQLIQLWMAEGFLRPCQEETTVMMEDEGHKVFQLLLQYSLLQDVELDEHKNITHCKMHDLVHDLARDILKSKLFDGKSVGGENLFHLRYFGWDSPSDQIDQINEPGRVYTLFWRCNSISEDMLLSFQFLRVLNLSKSGIEELSASISKLIYLRYLDLSYTNIKALPNSICKLYNMQTLRVNNCWSLKVFPDEMGNLISLRHIYYESNEHFQMPLNMGQLTCLQTLEFFNVGSEKGRRIEELGRLKNLRGALTIYGLQLVRNREEAGIAYLRDKSNISKLAYLWFHDEPEGCETNDEHVLDALQPHPNLKTLVVEDYLGTRFPSWFSEELLPNLVKLKLSGCKRCKETPPLGKLKLLRHLELIGFRELECIGPTFYGVEVNNNGSSNNNTNIPVFPLLKELVLRNMPSLSEWKEVQLLATGNDGRHGVGVRMFPVLERLRIRGCPRLKSTPNQFEKLLELEIDGVDSDIRLLNCTNFSSFPVPGGEKYLTNSFRYLRLLNCHGLTSLTSGLLEHCRSLEFLTVRRCNNLVSLPLHVWEMPSLTYLSISLCPKLISVPAAGLHRLTGLLGLTIGPFSEMVDFEAFQLIFNGIQQLLSLKMLCVYGREHWDSLPHQLMQLSALKWITITDFGIHSLPRSLGNLTSLESLELVSCKRLQHLDFLDAMPKLKQLKIRDCPLLEALSDGLVNLFSLQELVLRNCEKLQHLPSRDAMQRLTKLQILRIAGCPQLEESCTNRSGPNSQWSNIFHIPRIDLGGTTIQDLRALGR